MIKLKGIITSDWHLRSQLPRCRKDENWIETQKNAIEQIYKYAKKYNCNVFIVGDIFHSHSETTVEVIQIVQNLAKKLKKLGLKLYLLAGNHDLLYHSSENIEKSAVGILLKSDNIFPISSYSEDVSAGNFDEETENKEIIFKHVLVFPDVKSLPPNVDAITAKELLSEYSNAEWIFTGDMHKNFHYEKNGRHVVNPGCLIREVSDMKDYKNGCYFVDTESEIVERLEIKDDEEFVDDSYILKEKEKTDRIEKFANKLKETKDISLDFISNVESAVKQNKLSAELVDTIEELLEV